jgi:hypothetical protein
MIQLYELMYIQSTSIYGSDDLTPFPNNTKQCQRILSRLYYTVMMPVHARTGRHLHNFYVMPLKIKVLVISITILTAVAMSTRMGTVGS